MPDGREPRRTPLHALHAAAGATMTDEAGWSMPHSYRDVGAECREVRSRAGLFDLSHLGRIRVSGDGAADLLDRLFTAGAGRQEDDTARYSLMLNDDGGIAADVLVSRLESFWLLTTAPACRQAVLDRASALAGEHGAKVDDQTQKTSMVAVAGPAAPAILDAVLPQRISDLPGGATRTGSVLIAKYIVLRTAYMGHWTLETVLTNMLVGRAWQYMTRKAGANRVPPAGQAAREVLRLEAGMPRYGRELHEGVDPVSAGLTAAVDLEHDFVGGEAVRRLLADGAKRLRVGLAAENEAAGQPPRRGAPVRTPAGADAGAVTSAAFSDAAGRVIAMAYVDPSAAEVGTPLVVGDGAERLAVRVAEMPFVPGS